MELSENVLLPQPDSSTDLANSASVDLFLDDFFKDTRTRTHAHACNPPGPDAPGRTHTCYHTHTRVLPSEEDDSRGKPPLKKSKRPSGNREAVRKYREKKKAHTAYLEEEVRKLRALNHQLVRKLQGQATLEAEILRLRGLLLDLRGKFDSELGAFPFQNSTDKSEEADCGVGCPDLTCFRPHVGLPSQAQAQADIDGTGTIFVSWAENCHPPGIDCGVKVGDNIVSPNGHSSDRVETLVPSTPGPLAD